MQLNKFLKNGMILICALIILELYPKQVKGEDKNIDIFSLCVKQYDSTRQDKIIFSVKLNSIQNVKMPTNSVVEFNPLEFLNPYDEDYFWILPEIEFFNSKLKIWSKYDSKFYSNYDYTPIIIDPSNEQTKIVKNSIDYFPSLFFLKDLPCKENEFRIRFYTRFKYEGVVIVMKSNWLNL